MSIKIPISAELDGTETEKSIAKINEKMNRLAQAIASANKVKFTPVGQGTLAELQQVENRFKELLKVSGALRDRVKATGQVGASFSGLDWNRMYDDPVMRQRRMQQAYQHVTAGTQYGLQIVPQAGGNPRAPAVQPPATQSVPPPAVPHGPSVGQTLGGVAGAGLRATGPVGGVVANAAGAGMSGGFAAGVLGLLGGLAALGIGKGISAVKEKVGAAGQEGIGYDTLKRTLGDVNVSFNALRASLRSASNNIDVTFEQSQKLGTDFAKLSGISKEQYKTIADEVSVGGGFGRSFGMDPEQSNAFFAQMRQFQVTSTTNDSRRLALMIGEAVGKSGTFSKTDEVLQALSNYAANQTRSGLASANVSGFAGMYSGLLGSRIPGMDAQGAASMLGRVNGSIASGGSAGEAGQNYLFSVLGRRFGLDPVQASMLQQQGAFGTGRMAFGAGSLYSRFSEKFGGHVPGAAATSDETNLSAIMKRLQRDYSSNPSLMLNATSRLLGVNENQAMALHTVRPQALGGMNSRMGRLGLNVSELSATGISALSNIESGDKGTLMAQAEALRSHKKKLSDDERRELDGAIAGGDAEKLKDVLAKLTYNREQEMTVGKETLQATQGVEKRLQELATHMVPAFNDMRNAMVYLSGNGKMGAAGINSALRDIERKEITGAGAARESEITARYGGHISQVNGRAETLRAKIDSRAQNAPARMANMTPAEKAAYNAETRALEAELASVRKNAPGMAAKLAQQRDAELARVRAETSGQLGTLEQSYGTPPAGAGDKPLTDREKLMRELARTDTLLGMAPGTSAAQIGKESNFNPGAYNKKSGAMGLAQVTPSTLAALQKRLGRNLNPFNEGDGVTIHREVMRENKARFGSDSRALAAYNSGWDPSKWGNAETTDYLSTIDRTRSQFTPMPEGGPVRSSRDEQQRVIFEGNFTLNNSSGAQVAAPVRVKKTVGAPRPSGG